MDKVHALPVIIRSRGARGLGLREIWDARELIYLLLLRDIRLRYRQTAFGLAWALIQPLLMMLIFSLVLGRAQDLHPAGVSYPLFALAALVPWGFFSQGLNGAANSLVLSERVIGKVYFARLVLPIAAAGSFLLDLGIGVAVLIVAVLAFGPPLTATVLVVLPLSLLAWLASLSIGIGLGAVNARYRDVRHVLPFLTQIWLFSTPVLYSWTIVPEGLRPLLALNPMTGVVQGFQWAVLGLEPRPDFTVATSIIVSLTLLTVSTWYFRQSENTFADVL